MVINMDDFDFSVDPSDDFAEFVNGNWKKNNKIPNNVPLDDEDGNINIDTVNTIKQIIYTTIIIV